MMRAALAFALLRGGASPIAFAAAEPLRQIDHSAITQDICANVVVHANGAIATLLRDDDGLARALGRLRGDDLADGNPAKRAATGELAALASALAENVPHGRDEIRRLHAFAGSTPPEHAAALTAFAFALGRVFERHDAMGRALQGFVAALDVSDVRGIGGEFAPTGSSDGARVIARANPAPPPQTSFVRRPLDTAALARALATDLENERAADLTDERLAASLADAAVTGC